MADPVNAPEVRRRISVLGVVLLFAGIITGVFAATILQTPSESATGVVRAVALGSKSQGTSVLAVNYRYSVGGRIFDGTDEVPVSAVSSPRVGDSVTVYHLARNPAVSSIGKPRDSLVWLFFSLATMGVGIKIILRSTPLEKSITPRQ